MTKWSEWQRVGGARVCALYSLPHEAGFPNEYISLRIPILSISCFVFNSHNFFYPEQNTLAFHRDTCCHLALCLQLILFHWEFVASTGSYGIYKNWVYPTGWIDGARLPPTSLIVSLTNS